MAYDLTPGGYRPPTAGTSFDRPGELRSIDQYILRPFLPRGFRPPTAELRSIDQYILRPFLPTVHFDGGGARLVLSGLIWNVREIHGLLHIVLVFESTFDS
jgi:hypothetical protein